MDIKNIGVADYNKCIFVCDSKNRQLSVLYLLIVIKWLYTELEQFKKYWKVVIAEVRLYGICVDGVIKKGLLEK